MVQLVQPEQPMPCCFLSPIITYSVRHNYLVNLSAFAPSCSHDNLDQICPQSLRDLTSSNHLCKAFRTTLYFRMGDSLPIRAENLTDTWLEWVNAVIPVTESINSTSLTGMVCVPTGSVFVHGGYHSLWASDSQCTGGNTS